MSTSVSISSIYRRVPRQATLFMLVLGSAVALSSATGCKDGGLGSLLGNDSAAQVALAALSPEVKDLASKYTSGLQEITKLLTGITSSRDALTSAGKLATSVNSFSDTTKALAALDPSTKQNVLIAFASELKSSNGAFTKELNRITGDGNGSFGSMGAVLGPLLERVSLFK